MKICLLTDGFLECTLPLARHLSLSGEDVEVINVSTVQYPNLAFFNLPATPKPKTGFYPEHRLKALMNKNLQEYISPFRFSVYINVPSAKKTVYNFYLACKLARYIKRQQFDVVNLIHGQNMFFIYIFFLLKNVPKVQSLHEVGFHDGIIQPKRKLLFFQLFNSKAQIITHSRKLCAQLLDIVALKKPAKKDDCHMVRFGLAEPNLCYGDDDVQEEFPTVLQFGYISKYKGVEDSVKMFHLLKERIPDLRLIIAGAGKLPFEMEEVEGEERITIINRNLSNDEIVNLNKRCTAVICPYKSASQSGIPMVSFLFNTPVIATDVGAFHEVIDNNVNGMLVPAGDLQALCDAVYKLITEEEFRMQLKRNISHIKNNAEFSWTDIAENTKNVYLRAIFKYRSQHV